MHLALDPEGRTVAVKVLHPHVAADGGALARLAREVETMRMVGGPHVAEVLDASLESARPYLVTRYVQGRPLSAVPVPVHDLGQLAIGLADALLAMHEAGVVHRDLKPANVMMTEGEPVVIDFGIASALDSLSVTASGAVVGTPGYLAPEVLEGRVAGMETDVFSFGATLAYAATGRQPFGQGPASAVAYRVVHHPPDLEGVPEWLEPLLRECLSPDPAARPTAAQICARLGVAPVSHVPRAAHQGGAAAWSRPAGDRPGGDRSSADDRSRAAGRPRAGAEPRAAAESREAAELREAAEFRADADDMSTREWRPGREQHRRSVEASRARHREKVRRRWLIGSGLFVSLLAAAARVPLPEVSLFLLAAYSLGVVVDAGVALVSRGPYRRSRLIADTVSVAGAIGICFGLAAMFSTFTLALFAGTALVVGVVFLLSA